MVFPLFFLKFHKSIILKLFFDLWSISFVSIILLPHYHSCSFSSVTNTSLKSCFLLMYKKRNRWLCLLELKRINHSFKEVYQKQWFNFWLSFSFWKFLFWRWYLFLYQHLLFWYSAFYIFFDHFFGLQLLDTRHTQYD